MDKLLSDLIYGLIAPLIALLISLLAGIGTFIMWKPNRTPEGRA